MSLPFFDKTWKAIQKDFNRLNPFDTPKDDKQSMLGVNREFSTVDTIAKGVAGEKYDFQSYTYPVDLLEGRERAFAPYMMIFINVKDGDEYKNRKNRLGEAEFVDEVSPGNMRIGTRIRGEISKDAAIATSALATTAVGGAVGGLIGGLPGAGAGAAMGLLGSAVMATTLESKDFKAGNKRLKTAIALPMPQQLDIRYGMQYKMDNAATTIGAMRTVGSVLASSSKAIDDLTSIMKAESDGLSGEDFTKIAGTSLKGISDIVKGVVDTSKDFGLAAAINTMPGGDTISTLTGIAPNPKLQSVFEGVDPRTFSYSYAFFPRSKYELDTIYRITKLLKYHMHPTFRGDSEFLFNYPSTFNIEFFVGADTNKYIHKHTGCVLTNMSIDYTPNGSYQYYNDGGAPLQINVRMDFRELEILTSEDIEDNY